jgi:hypothetical protein
MWRKQPQQYADGEKIHTFSKYDIQRCRQNTDKLYQTFKNKLKWRKLLPIC